MNAAIKSYYNYNKVKDYKCKYKWSILMIIWIKIKQNWSYIPDHPYRTLIVGGSGSGKTNVLLNLINNQPDVDKIHLYAKDPYEAKYQFLINKRGSTGLKHFYDPKAFIDYSKDMEDVDKNIDEYK